MHRVFFQLFLLGVLITAAVLSGARDPGQAAAVLHGDKYMPFYWQMIWPHAVVADGRVFCAFQNSLGQPMIMAYDIEHEAWSDVVLVSERAVRQFDTHGNPSITIDADGHLHLFHSSHVSTQFHRRSVRPYDVSEWEPLNPPAAHATYPQSFYLKDGRMFLFFRDGFHYDAWQMMISSDDGESWDSMTDLVDMRRDPVDIFAGAYIQFRPGAAGDTIHAFWVHKDDNPRLVRDGIMLASPRGEVKYPDMNEAVYRYNLYTMKRLADGVWVDARGEAIELPVTKRMADDRCRIYDSGDEFVGVRGIAVGTDDRPYVHFTSGVRDWASGGPEIVPTRHLYATPGGDGNWSIEEGLPDSWPPDVRSRFFDNFSNGGIAQGDPSHGQWVFDFEYADDGRTLLYLTHSEKGIIPRKGGPADCP